MEWQEPKINWTEKDAFNIVDFNRIRGNLLYLWQHAKEVCMDFEIKEMGQEVTSYKTGWNVEYFNAFEENVDKINKNTFEQDYGLRQTFYINGVFIQYNELNRIENAILNIKKIIDGIELGRIRIPFRLGMPKGMRP